MENLDNSTGIEKQGQFSSGEKCGTSYETSFTCQSTEDLRGGFAKLQADIISHLNVSGFNKDPLKVVGVKTKRVSSTVDDKQVTTIEVKVDFESCSLVDAHYFFSAEVGIASAPSAKMMYHLVASSQGKILDRKSQAANFKELRHGDVTFFETFENEFVFGSMSVKACVTFASAQAPIESCIHDAFRRSQKLMRASAQIRDSTKS